MAKRDYYDVLGLPQTASAEDIRRAHRRLARQLHPDVNKASDAPKRFADVQEAYEVLSDERKRSIYDRAGHAGLEADAAGASQAPRQSTRRGPTYSWTNIGGGPPGASPHLDDLFDTFFGSARDDDEPARAPRKSGRAQRQRATPARHHEIAIDFMTAALGGTQPLRLDADRLAKTIDVSIPPGIDDGAQLRVRGVIEPDKADLLLTIRVRHHPVFRRGNLGAPPAGLDVSVELPITIAEATLGATVLCPTLSGKVELAVPPGSPSGRMLRLRGMGVRPPSGSPGDHYAVLRIVPPDPARLTEADRLALREIAARTPNPRDSG
jgi:DnaJ-class molecular chaperone